MLPATVEDVGNMMKVMSGSYLEGSAIDLLRNSQRNIRGNGVSFLFSFPVDQWFEKTVAEMFLYILTEYITKNLLSSLPYKYL